MSKKKGPVFKNKNKRNRHGTNCNDSNRVIAGRSPDDIVPYSWNVQKSIEHYIKKYSLQCSILQFENRVPWRILCTENELSNEFLDVFGSRVIWSVASRYQKLTEKIMDKYEKKLDWSSISWFQGFSTRFIVRHLNQLDMDIVMSKRSLVTQEELERYQEAERDKKEFLEGGDEVEDRFDILDL